MGEDQMKEIASVIKKVLSATSAPKLKNGKISKTKYLVSGEVRTEAKSKVLNLLNNFPLYPELDLGFLEQEFLIEQK